MSYRTQKAKGLEVLAQTLHINYAWMVATLLVPDYTVYDLTNPEHIKMLNYKASGFMRPCPMFPRHGFVDSRMVHTATEMQQIISETLAADDKAEMISMHPLKAVASAVWNPSKLTLGGGNDGATAGHNAYSIPLAFDSLFPPTTLEKAHITNTPYMEVVYSKNDYNENGYNNAAFNSNLVQLRDGPEQPATLDYIPRTSEVKHVAIATGDLLQWEATVKSLPEGTAIWHPKGSLASHYAVHAIAAGFPVMVSREPKVGETLIPETDTPKPDAQAMRDGFYTFINTAEVSESTAVFLMLAGLHNSSAWYGRNDYILGAAMGATFRLTAQATIGELRHKHSIKREGSTLNQRTEVYQAVREKIKEYRFWLPYVRDNFRFGPWDGGFGGAKWAEVAESAIRLYNAVMLNDTGDTLSAFNAAVNTVHNNGWTFSKWVQSRVLDLAAKHPSIPAIASGPVIYSLLNGPRLRCKWMPSVRMRREPKIIGIHGTVDSSPFGLNKSEKNGRARLYIRYKGMKDVVNPVFISINHAQANFLRQPKLLTQVSFAGHSGKYVNLLPYQPTLAPKEANNVFIPEMDTPLPVGKKEKQKKVCRICGVIH